MNFRAE